MADLAYIVSEFGISVSIEMDNLVEAWLKSDVDKSQQSELRGRLRHVYRKVRAHYISEREKTEEKDGGLAYLTLSGERKDFWQELIAVCDVFFNIVWCVTEALIENDDDLIQFWNRFVVEDLNFYRRCVIGNRYNRAEVFVMVGRNLEKLMADIFGTRCDSLLLFEYATDQFCHMTTSEEVAMVQMHKTMIGLFGVEREKEKEKEKERKIVWIFCFSFFLVCFSSCLFLVYGGFGRNRNPS